MDGAGRTQAAATLTGALARFGAAFSLDDVPEDDRHHAKLLALDRPGRLTRVREILACRAACPAEPQGPPAGRRPVSGAAARTAGTRPP